MRYIWGAIVLFALVTVSTIAVGQNSWACYCGNSLSVSPVDGSIWIQAWSQIDSGYSCDMAEEDCYESAGIGIVLSDTARGAFFSDYGDDFLSPGWANYSKYFGPGSTPQLNDQYNLHTTHSVEGNYDVGCNYVDGFTGECGGQEQYVDISDYEVYDTPVYVPPKPSVQACSVVEPEAASGNAQRGAGEAQLYYCVNPPVLNSAVIVIGPDVGSGNNPNYGPFPFSAYDMPYGTSYAEFIGSYYGLDVFEDNPNNAASVTRTRLAITDDSWARWTGKIICDEATYQNQDFYLKSVESPNDWFTYHVVGSTDATDDLSLGGIAIVYVDQAVEGCSLLVGQPPLLGVSGTNQMWDNLGSWWAGMAPPVGETEPPNNEYYQSAVNSWSLFFQPWRSAQICSSFTITSDDLLVGTAQFTECLNN